MLRERQVLARCTPPSVANEASDPKSRLRVGRAPDAEVKAAANRSMR